MAKNIPNVYNMYIPNGHKIYQPFTFQGPKKITQIGIFGLKIYNLATLFSSRKSTFGEIRYGEINAKCRKVTRTKIKLYDVL
jgi:hypothetical protein